MTTQSASTSVTQYDTKQAAVCIVNITDTWLHLFRNTARSARKAWSSTQHEKVIFVLSTVCESPCTSISCLLQRDFSMK